MLGKKRFDHITSLVVTLALTIGASINVWAQAPRSAGQTNAAATLEDTSNAVLLLVCAVLVVAAIVIVMKLVSRRRRRLEEALVLQAQISDVLLRETQLRGLVITPTARVPRRPTRPLTI